MSTATTAQPNEISIDLWIDLSFLLLQLQPAIGLGKPLTLKPLQLAEGLVHSCVLQKRARAFMSAHPPTHTCSTRDPGPARQPLLNYLI